LEATKHRQAKEIRELRRKLRESRLVLPPRAYRAVSHDDEVDDDEEEEEEDGGDENKEGKVVVGQDDDAYTRVVALLEVLLESAKNALETKPADFVGNSKGGAKVLSAEEVKDWGGLEVDNGLGRDADDRPITPAHTALPSEDDDDDLHVENDILRQGPILQS
jgi:hypothetical protein